MIKFCCDYCAHKISVLDTGAGKQGKCPKCGNVITIPAESTIIEFLCEYCERRISVPKSRAGKKAICPQCNNMFIIPAIHAPGSDAAQDYSGDLIARSTDSPHDLTLLDVPEEYKLKDEPVGEVNVSEEAVGQQQESEEDSEAEETESVTQRDLPWLVDIFLYPTSAPGLVHLTFFVGAQVVLYFLWLLPLGLITFILSILVGLYICWYITECIRDSAAGRIRAPEAFATSSFGEMYSQCLHIIGCCLIFFGPVGFYRLWIQRMDVLFWVLLAYGIFFFPMGLLACVMFDSIRGLSPVLLLASIFSTFVQYCGLVLLVAVIVLAVVFFTHMQGTENTEQSWVSNMLFMILFNGITFYATFVVVHLLGRFFWRNKEKLNWEV
ncbi:MAG: hypothetical protein ACYS3S_21635 [Planctomycetota bacterium]